MSLALLFPGQGAQQPRMLDTLPDAPSVAAVVDESRAICADLALPPDIDSAEHLRDTVATQISLVIAGVATARALITDEGLVPEFVAGHSVGAFSAAVVADVLTLREALDVVRMRGESMRAACAGGDWGMAAITGLSPRAARQLAASVTSGRNPAWVANVNSASQTVLGGTAVALSAAREAADAAGATKFERLEVAVASHGPIQHDTARRLRAHLSTLRLNTPAMRYVTNTGGRSVATASAVVDDLAQSVSHPVQWFDGIQLIVELGVTCSIETGPGHTLTRLMTATAPRVAALAVFDDGLSGAAARAR